MPRKVYTSEERTKIIDAVKEAIPPWDNKLTAAKKAGYTGEVQGLMKAVRKWTGGAKKAKGKSKKSPYRIAMEAAESFAPKTASPSTPLTQYYEAKDRAIATMNNLATVMAELRTALENL